MKFNLPILIKLFVELLTLSLFIRTKFTLGIYCNKIWIFLPSFYIYIEQKLFRKAPWQSSHLRTFKHHLWQKINHEDLLDTDGNFYKMTWDLSFMFPMLEMSDSRSFFIEKLLYVYNLDNPFNDHKVDNSYQLRLESEIRNKKVYDTVTKK